VNQLFYTMPRGLSETWAKPDEYVVDSEQLRSSAASGCKFCELHLEKIVEKRLLNSSTVEKRNTVTDASDDPSGELVVSLQMFARESVDLCDMVRLVVAETSFDVYTHHGN